MFNGETLENLIFGVSNKARMPIIVKYIIILEICSVSIEIKEIQLSLLVADKIVTYRTIYRLTGFNKEFSKVAKYKTNM